MPLIKAKELKKGTNVIIDSNIQKEAFFDFKILLLDDNESFALDFDRECLALLVEGKAVMQWKDQETTVERKSCFRNSPYCLHLPAGKKAKIKSMLNGTQFALFLSENQKSFEPLLYGEKQCTSENRGAGTLNECATRIVTNIMSRDVCPESNFVMGEVINYPGKWSSFPPHSHTQPEIYHYRFLPKENGYGFSQDGEDAYIVKDGDTLLALNGKLHPQVSAPGYAMYYIWAIRNFDDMPYQLPPPVEKHAWTIKPGAKYFPEDV